MKTINELNGDILNIILFMQEAYPELLMNIDETPLKYSNASVAVVTNLNLHDYFNALNNMLIGYAVNHAHTIPPGLPGLARY